MNKSANEYRDENIRAIKEIWLRDFVKAGALNCPNWQCKSDDIMAVVDDGNVSFYYVPIRCNSCGATWTNVFDVVEAIELEIPGVE